jgi:outer membrane receptor protein involved in Fe transport
VRAVHSPEAEDIGGTNAAARAANCRAARDRDVLFDAGETVDELNVAWSWPKAWAVHEVILRNDYNCRDFDALLPLQPFLGQGAVQFDRFFFDGGAQYSNATGLLGHANRITIGVDADHMTDDHLRFDNLAGVRGPLQFFDLDHRIGRSTISPTVGILNLFDEDYNTDIRIEDATNRFFEPAPDRNAFGGVRVRYDFDV